MTISIHPASGAPLAMRTSAPAAVPRRDPLISNAAPELPTARRVARLEVAAPANPLAGLPEPGGPQRLLARLDERRAAGAPPSELRGLMRAAVPAIVRERTALAMARARGDSPALQARQAQLDDTLSQLVPAAAAIGDEGTRILSAVARVLFGPEASVVAGGPGHYALWSERSADAPAMVATLPAAAIRERWTTHTPLRAPPAIGSHPRDAAPIAGDPILGHIAATSRTAVTAGDLYRDGANLTAAPDPTALLATTHAANAEAQVTGAHVRMLSYNVALLSYKLFGFYDHKTSPLLEERREPLARAIFGGGDDVIALQEVWRREDVELFTRVAAAQGYRAFVAPRTRYNDGVVTFVRESMIAPGTTFEHRAKAYETQDWLEWWAAELTTLGMDVGVKRGFHEIAFTHPTAGRMVIFNTHMQAFPDKWRERMQQSRELGLAAAARDSSEVVLMAGDMNSGPFYRDDRRTRGGETSAGWWSNALAYPMLQHYSGARDLVIMGRRRAEADDDVERAGLEAGAEPVFPFTASHTSNELYRRQYGDSEFEARLDHVLGRAPGRLKVTSSEMAYTGDVKLPSGQVSELSDHYGVRVNMVIRGPMTGDR